MPLRENQFDNLYNHPPLNGVDGLNLPPAQNDNVGLADTDAIVFGPDALDAALSSALDAIAINTALESLAAEMSLDRKTRFLEFVENYVGDSNPVNRKGIHAELPNSTVENPYGEDFCFSLPCIAVISPDTGKIIVVSKDPYKDKWRVVLYDTLEENPEKAISEEIVQNAQTHPRNNTDVITLDIVGMDSPRYTDFYLQFYLKKEDYSRDEKQPVKLHTVVPYGQKPNVYEYPVDVNFLCEKINLESEHNVHETQAEQRITERKIYTEELYREIGHVADRAA